MSNWTIVTDIGELVISKVCMESSPCQHKVHMGGKAHVMDALDLWDILKVRPRFQEQEPQLWKHFSVYADLPNAE